MHKTEGAENRSPLPLYAVVYGSNPPVGIFQVMLCLLQVAPKHREVAMPHESLQAEDVRAVAQAKDGECSPE